MPPPYEHHVFVCTNRRTPSDPKGCCVEKGSEEVHALFKAEVARRGLRGRVRVNSAGCLDACALGVSVVIYPEAVWYGGVKPEDVNEIIEQHLIVGRPVERLLMKLRPAASVPGLAATAEKPQ
jgi:(2Fe-2S) ferredoxin